MIERMKYVANENLTVCYSYVSEAVYVVCKKTQRTRTFGGWDKLFELFMAFYNNVTEETEFDDAVKFFRPEIGSLTVNPKS